MDYERALAKVDEYLALCGAAIEIQQARVVGYSDLASWRDLNRKITEGLPLIEKIAEAVDPRLADRLRERDAVIQHRQKQEACREVRGAIVDMELTAAILAPPGPKLPAKDFHPWVWDHAAGLWSDGYRRAAVQAAATALFDTYAPAKLGRPRDRKGGNELMGAFSTQPPEPGMPRLRFKGISPGTDEWTSAHDGAMKLGQGAAQAIRNVTTHDLTEPEEQEALEMLAVLSYVARLVEAAEIDEVP